MNKINIKKILIFCLAGIITISLAQYLLVNSLATRGGELAKLLSEESLLREENQRLLSEVAKLTSLTRVLNEGERIGMVPAKNYLSLRPASLAQNIQSNLASR